MPKPCITLHCDETLQTFENTREMYITRAANFLVFSNARRVLSQCNTRFRLLSIVKDVRTQNVPTHIFFFKLATKKGNDLLLPKRQKKKMGREFWREHAPKNTSNLKNRASLASKATVSVSPKILQLDCSIVSGGDWL